MKYLSLALLPLLASLHSLSTHANVFDRLALSQYVDPFIGTGTFKGDYKTILEDNPGMTHPSPIVPFGMISWGPNTISNHDEKITNKYERDIGYQYESKRIEGFALTHISGAGCPNSREMPILPFVGTPTEAAVFYSHQDEKASAGYYQVGLANGVNVELTTKSRMGYGKFRFKNLKNGTAYGFQFFASRRANPPDKTESITQPEFHFQDDRHFSGFVEGGDFCSSLNKYKLYFAGEVNQAGALTTFDQKTARMTFVSKKVGVEEIELKIAISFVSEAGAKENLEIERQDENGNEESFESTRIAALREWEKVLNTIQIDTESIHDKRNFYTALYHAFSHPNVHEDVNGLYRGYDDQIHEVKKGHHHYQNFSGWDIYRSEIQLLAILFKNKASDMAQSLVDAAEQCGGIPEWALNNSDTAVMVGDAGPVMLGDFYSFGADQFDLKKALKFMVKSGTDPASGCNGHPSRPGLNAYLAQGYLAPKDVEFGFVSTTLEYEISDFAISRFASRLGETDLSESFLKQAGNWKKLWWHSKKDFSIGYLRGKKKNGKWLSPFVFDENPDDLKDPENPKQKLDQGFVEGTAAQYSLMIPFDFAGVLKEMGTPEQAQKRLNSFFDLVNGGMDAPYMHIGNEPSFSSPWIYLWTKEPYRTQEVVHRTIKTSFYDVPGGLPGNDDLGATSSWYVLAALGLYPVIPGEEMLGINTPYFPKILLNLESGNKIHIQSEGQGHFIKALSVNGKPSQNTWLNWSEIQNGAKLQFNLAKKPTHWGENSLPPPSFSSP